MTRFENHLLYTLLMCFVLGQGTALVLRPAETGDLSQDTRPILDDARMEPSYRPLFIVEPQFIPVNDMDSAYIPMNSLESPIMPVNSVGSSMIPVRNVESQMIPVRNVDSSMIPVRNVESQMIPVGNVDSSMIPMRNVEYTRPSLLKLLKLRNIRSPDGIDSMFEPLDDDDDMGDQMMGGEPMAVDSESEDIVPGPVAVAPEPIALAPEPMAVAQEPVGFVGP